MTAAGRGGTRCRRRSRWPCRRAGGWRSGRGRRRGRRRCGGARLRRVRRGAARPARRRLAQLVRRPAARRRPDARRPRQRGPPTGPNQCHDITVYPDVGLAGGACAGLGLLLDIREAAHPIRIDFVGRPEHVVLALGHVQQRRQEGALLRRVGRRRRRRAAARRTSWSGAPTRSSPSRTTRWCSRATTRCRPRRPIEENCVAHNGSLIPIPGRDVMVQALYQGGVVGVRLDRRGATEGNRVLRPRSDRRRRGWSAAARGRSTGTTACIVSSEIARGLDIFELVPSALITQNEIDAAKTVQARLLEHAGAAEVRVAAELRAGAGVSSISSSGRRACRRRGSPSVRDGARRAPRRRPAARAARR